MSDFLDELAIMSNEKSEFLERDFSVVMRSAHPTIPHAASLCVETAELLVIGRANGLISIAYMKAVEPDIFRALVRDRRMTFENVGYVEKVLGAKSKDYKQVRQLPISIYSNEAKISALRPQRRRQDGALFNILFAKKNVRLPSPKGGYVTVDCPPLAGEILIENPANFSEFSAYDKGIEIQGERYDLHQIDYAMLAAISFVEW
ncbi:hypothetical protein F3I62_18820 [Pseudomonas sp. R-28-1W-6]|uniref:hypothetical protein n=1 Tax=Pseudomonas sp. R-28-1W-6 TaxID=2650101 RepID=UPI0013664B59|nr:hypothetical protein [Pseudomonas sp. R-28-1W-6]MWV14158.1 hypothetical protein [Pseudomonas sp. R-28-1W-6]